jgi:hypothetical protein
VEIQSDTWKEEEKARKEEEIAKEVEKSNCSAKYGPGVVARRLFEQVH